jgi:hypothetical protein
VRIDATSEMLSAFVRSFGCVAIWIRMAESGGGFGGRPLPDESAGVLPAPLAATAAGGFVGLAAESRGRTFCLLGGGASDFAPQAAARLNKNPSVGRAMVMVRCGQCNGCTRRFLV